MSSNKPWMIARPSYMPKYWPVPSSCVLYLEGQQDPQSGTIKDLSGYNNHGTITGAVWERNARGLWTLKYDGNDDYITIGTTSTFNFTTGNFTLMAWVKVTDVTSARNIFCRGLGNTEGYDFFVETNSRYYLQTYQAGAKTRRFTDVLTMGSWVLATAVRDGATGKIYINNTQGDSGGDVIADPVTSVRNLRSGVSDNITGDFLGNMALHRIWNRALSATEISNIFNQERSLFNV